MDDFVGHSLGGNLLGMFLAGNRTWTRPESFSNISVNKNWKNLNIPVIKKKEEKPLEKQLEAKKDKMYMKKIKVIDKKKTRPGKEGAHLKV